MNHALIKAFSLVELSIVLVILGLLTGGILAGKSLVRASELRASTRQLANYHTAVYTFRDKYFYIPGDMTNATRFWGIAAGATGNDDTCFSASSTDSTTCNGDGNGLVDAPSAATGLNIVIERFLFWKHLSSAGLIEGSYTGTHGTSASASNGGVNVPKTKTSNGIFMTWGRPALPSGNSEYYPMPQQNMLVINADGGGAAGTLIPEEAWNIDSKLDDGKPALGKMTTFKKTSTFGPNCSDGDTTAADYDFTITAKNCRLMYGVY
jgi:prepilin-type N-terminal cleavage/methylation domain-containing protein